MKGIFFLVLCLMSVPGRRSAEEITVKGFTTCGILVYCHFDDQHKDKQKYFCKGDASSCPDNRLTHSNDSRFIQYENTHRNKLTVLIANLTSQDTGTYHCAAEDRVLHQRVFLNITEGDCCESPTTIIGQERENINIYCKYPVESKTNIKQLYKQREVFIETKHFGLMAPIKNKNSLSDNQTANSFTVTIHEVKKKDAGTYWCGVRTGHDIAILIRKVELRITERSGTVVKAFTKGGVLIYCHFDDQYNDKQKYFCKGDASSCPENRLTHSNDNRFIQYESADSHYLTVLITNLTSEDAGTYHCATEDGVLHDRVILKTKQGDCCDSPTTITGQMGSNIIINCKYPVESKTDDKHFCKQHESFLDRNLIESKPPNMNHKYSLSDNHTENVFTVTIYKLRRKDAGTYWCGVRTDGGNVALIGKVELKITGRTVGSVQEKGFTNGGIIILCKFNDQNPHRQRNFCKGNGSTCPNNQLSQETDSRFSTYSSVLMKQLIVLITNLTSDDAGTYYCTEGEDLLTEVHLNIENGDCCGPPIEKTVHEGGNVSIECKYPVEFTNNFKHFCKILRGCMTLDLSESKPSNIKQRYWLSENKSYSVFTVTITDLTASDDGVYWCGVGSNAMNVALLTEVKLHVRVTDKEGAVMMRGVLVVTALGVAVTLVFLCYRHRQKRKRERSSRVIYHQTENPDQDVIYEEIEDIGLATSKCICTTVDNTDDPTYHTIQSPSDLPDDTGLHLLSNNTPTAISSVYAIAQLPTIPCDAPTYLNIQSPTHTSGDTYANTVTNKTDSALNNVYVTAQRATVPNNRPTQYADQLDTTNSANQEPTNTNEETVCKINDSFIHSSDNTDYSMVSGATNTKINTVYVTAKFQNNANDDTTYLNVLEPINPNNEPAMCTDQVPLTSDDNLSHLQ